MSIKICHFPGFNLDNYNNASEFFINKKIKVDPNIAIIIIGNQPFIEGNYTLNQQLKNLPYYYSQKGYNTIEWNMVNKIDYILEVLKERKEKYALILDIRDVVITGDLDKDFIASLKHYNKSILYNGNKRSYPPSIFPDDRKGNWPYLNAGVCFGEINKLKEFYLKVLENKENYPENPSEQFLIRKTIQDNEIEYIGVDFERKYLCCFHEKDEEVYVENNEVKWKPSNKDKIKKTTKKIEVDSNTTLKDIENPSMNRVKLFFQDKIDLSNILFLEKIISKFPKKIQMVSFYINFEDIDFLLNKDFLRVFQSLHKIECVYIECKVIASYEFNLTKLISIFKTLKKISYKLSMVVNWHSNQICPKEKLYYNHIYVREF